MRKQVRWLLAEVDAWVGEGIIEPDQGEALRCRYLISSQGGAWGKIIFSCLGAVLFGLGAILLFAYNWEEMHKFAKLAVVFVALAAAHGGGLWLQRSGNRYKAVGDGLHVLGTVLFGAGIWLIAQIYHIDEHYPNALLVWGLGALALGWALPSTAQGILASVLFLLWNGFEVFGFHGASHLAPLLLLGAVMPLAWARRSLALTGVAGVSLILALSFNCAKVDDGLILPVLLFTGAIFIGESLMTRRSTAFPQSGGILSFLGTLLYMGVLYSLSFPGVIKHMLRVNFSSDMALMYYWIPVAMAAALWLAVLLPVIRQRHTKFPGFRPDHFGVPAVLLVVILQAPGVLALQGWAGAGLFNLLFLFHCIMLIMHGCKTVSLKTATVGCLLFFLLAVTRYVDLFESLIARSLVFFVIGASIFAVGIFYSRSKKEAQESMA